MRSAIEATQMDAATALMQHDQDSFQPRACVVPVGHALVLVTLYAYVCADAQSLRNSNQILHGDQTILEGNFYRVDHGTTP